jgi:hypothetical protein
VVCGCVKEATHWRKRDAAARVRPTNPSVLGGFFHAARRMLRLERVEPQRVAVMSQRTHFWLRVIGCAAILAAQFGPRFWSAMPASQNARVAAAAR